MAAKTAQKAPATPAAAPETAAKAAPKAAASKAAPAAKAAGGGFAKPMTPSKELAAIVGAAPLPRSEVVKKVWEHIKKHDLQDPKAKREIIADADLKKVFGKDRATMFEMNKLISGHLS